MVKSTIDENILYDETKIIDPEDKGHTSSVYSIEIEKEDIEVAIGKEKYTYSQKNIISYPIYFILNNTIKERIGIFEITSDEMINALDEEGDIDINKGNLLIFSYVNEEYLKKLSKEKQEETKDTEDKEDETKDKEVKEDDIVDESEDNEEDEEDVTKVKIRNSDKKKEDDELKEGIFKENSELKKKEMLKEETELESKEIKSNYEEKLNSDWINKFLKNNNYGIIDNDGTGDCFFITIRDAYETEGKMTTIKKLRAILSKNATDEQYQQYKAIYKSLRGELGTKQRNMDSLKKTGKVLKSQHALIESKLEGEKILHTAKENLNEYQKMELEKSEVEDLLEEFDFMEKVESFEDFKAILKTNEYWADTWAITTLEKELNMKVIILSEESYYAGDLDSVMLCGQLNEDEINTSPEYYIIVSYTGMHYKLITYKEKSIFKFKEIPYDVKMLIINKCMEKNSGPYYLLKDFRELKMNMGLSSDEGQITKDDEEINYEMFDPETVLMFYSKSDPKPKAGKGSGEKIKESRVLDFNKLNKDKKLMDWRRKLDDSWKASYEIDGKKWASVDHYYYGSQFKKGFPDFYNTFSLDSNSEISLDPKKAKAAASTKGKYEKKQLRPENVKHDADFFEIGPEQRSITERLIALRAKFSQNIDMKKVLLETRDAKLVKFVRGSPPEVDHSLMLVRKELQKDL